MRNVSAIVGRDGVRRLYFRTAGHAAIPLKAAEGTPALGAEVEALRQALKRSQRQQPGTLKAAIRAYEDAADYRNLAASTRYIYKLMLKELEADLGALPVETFVAAYILELRDAWALRGHRAANQRLQILGNVLRPAIIAGRIGQGDPFALIPHVRRPHDAGEPHQLWSPATVDTAIRAAAAEKRFGLARAIALARFAGPRRADLVRLTKAARQDGRFRFLSGKKRVPVDVREDAALTAWLAELPDRQPLAPWRRKRGGAAIETLHLVFGMRAPRYTAGGVGQELAKLMAALHAAGAVDSADYDFHGLRHTRGVELALAGVTDAQGAAMMGHASPASFAIYRRQADRIKLSDAGQDLLDAYRERQPNAELHTPAHKLHTPPAGEKGSA